MAPSCVDSSILSSSVLSIETHSSETGVDAEGNEGLERDTFAEEEEEHKVD